MCNTDLINSPLGNTQYISSLYLFFPSVLSHKQWCATTHSHWLFCFHSQRTKWITPKCFSLCMWIEVIFLFISVFYLVWQKTFCNVINVSSNIKCIIFSAFFSVCRSHFFSVCCSFHFTSSTVIVCRSNCFRCTFLSYT